MCGLSGTELDAVAIFREALAGCDAGRALKEKLPEVGAGSPLDLSGVRRLLVIAMGKGAAGMLQAVMWREDIVAGREVRGVLVAPVRPGWLPDGIEFCVGAHPLPAESSFAAARAILQLLGEEPACGSAVCGTFCLFLISGGASAMVELPLTEGIGLEDTVALYRELVLSGAAISEINCVRKHFSRVKGGRLAFAARHLRQFTLLMSDVPEGQEDALASGPTVADRSTVAECRQALRRYGLMERLAGPVARYFDGEIAETPKLAPGGAMVLLSAADLAAQARRAAERLGYSVTVDNGCDDWGYREAADYLLGRMRERRRGPTRKRERVCLISVGEVLVKVPAELQGAVGGRNQHLALEAALRMGEEDAGVAMLACGSDGVDGNSVAAGAVVRGEMFGAGVREQAEAALKGFGSYAFLRGVGRVVETGATGVNLRDLRVLVAG